MQYSNNMGKLMINNNKKLFPKTPLNFLEVLLDVWVLQKLSGLIPLPHKRRNLDSELGALLRNAGSTASLAGPGPGLPSLCRLFL